MTETKTKIREVLSTFCRYFRQPIVTYRENVCAAQRTAYCVIASNSVFSNIVSSYLILSHSFWCNTWV